MTATIDSGEVTRKVVVIAQNLLEDSRTGGGITVAAIVEAVDDVLAMKPAWASLVDRAAIIDELVRRNSTRIGKPTVLVDVQGHIPWLDSKRKGDWRYWQRYREWKERDLSNAVVEALDESTDGILELLEDPLREGPWDRRGLVVGHVQSGKTANYTGLICKAADAGYKIIIVLAGLHNNLRAQTQMRLDEEFLGFETKFDLGDGRVIGVGEIDGDPEIRPNFATTRAEGGDFSTKVARNLGIKPEQRPWLFVVKKNKTVLERLLGWIRHHVADYRPEAGEAPIVTKLPLLLIDDEADHASVDTGNQEFDEDGKPDPEHQPTVINRLIRQILKSFDRSAFVGYTATPFANIFIHERGKTDREGPDLFPSSFIVNLSAPSNYVGPARVFGQARGDENGRPLPLIRQVNDHGPRDGHPGWMPNKHQPGHVPRFSGADDLPPSLVEAIDAFLLACSVRVLRGQGTQPSSMLVHVTRFNAVQSSVARQVEQHVRQIRQRLTRNVDHERVLARLESLWERDFVPTSRAVIEEFPELGQHSPVGWADVLGVLPDVLADIEFKTINGHARDVLDYADRAGQGVKVIAIGGDKLARGLTLEGLSVSYFLRATRMYDTLMQMGRWFGYRPGYLDLCRMYMTADLDEWFRHVTDASEELRAEFDLMAERGATPREYGLKVQSHPVLMVTSKLKMRSARDLWLSFSGDVVETVTFPRDPRILRTNLGVLETLVREMGESVTDIQQLRDGKPQTWNGHLWEGVSHDPVVSFLEGYRTHEAAHKVNGALMAEFIRGMAAAGELTSWTVALLAGGQQEAYEVSPGTAIELAKRSPRGTQADRYSIGRLLSPRDETLDLDDAAWQAALAETRRAWAADPARLQDAEPPEQPSGPAIRRIRGLGIPGKIDPHPERGLLLLYLLDPAVAGLEAGAPPVVGFGISFPGSKSGNKVKYAVNNVLWEQEYGPAS